MVRTPLGVDTAWSKHRAASIEIIKKTGTQGGITDSQAGPALALVYRQRRNDDGGEGVCGAGYAPRNAYQRQNRHHY